MLLSVSTICAMDAASTPGTSLVPRHSLLCNISPPMLKKILTDEEKLCLQRYSSTERYLENQEWSLQAAGKC